MEQVAQIRCRVVRSRDGQQHAWNYTSRPRRRLWHDRLPRLLLSAPSLPLNSSVFQHEHAIWPDVGAVRNLALCRWRDDLDRVSMWPSRPPARRSWACWTLIPFVKTLAYRPGIAVCTSCESLPEHDSGHGFNTVISFPYVQSSSTSTPHCETSPLFCTSQHYGQSKAWPTLTNLAPGLVNWWCLCGNRQFQTHFNPKSTSCLHS